LRAPGDGKVTES